jgi:hypothetical protein
MPWVRSSKARTLASTSLNSMADKVARKWAAMRTTSGAETTTWT